MNELKPELVDQLERIVPFGIVLSNELKIEGLGRSLRRLHPAIGLGKLLEEPFEVLQARTATPVESLAADLEAGKFLIVRLRETGLRLRGNGYRLGPDRIFLALSPAISSEQELHGVGLRYDDLPLYDNTLDLLILLRAHATTLDESRKLATKLQAKNDEFELTRKELAHALEKEQISTRFRNRVLGMLSHEFRTSLAQILSVAELLRRGIKLDQSETVRKHGETLSNAVTQIMEAFDSLSHYARSEGSWEQEREAIDVAELIHEAIRRVRTPESEGIRVVGPAAGSPGPRMESSRSLLLIALTNLLSNAIKYSKAGGEVRVGCAECEGEIAISVEDEGIGIPASLQPEVFETYVRGTNVGNVPGTGLGLAVVTLCVNALGGKVHLRSTQDVGTRATITLPVKRP